MLCGFPSTQTHPTVWGDPLPDLKIWCWGGVRHFFLYLICFSLSSKSIPHNFGFSIAFWRVFQGWKFNLCLWFLRQYFAFHIGSTLRTDFEFELQRFSWKYRFSLEKTLFLTKSILLHLSREVVENRKVFGLTNRWKIDKKPLKMVSKIASFFDIDFSRVFGFNLAPFCA